MRKVMLVLVVAALAVLGTSCNQLKARDQLNKGVQQFTAKISFGRQPRLCND